MSNLLKTFWNVGVRVLRLWKEILTSQEWMYATRKVRTLQNEYWSFIGFKTYNKRCETRIQVMQRNLRFHKNRLKSQRIQQNTIRSLQIAITFKYGFIIEKFGITCKIGLIWLALIPRCWVGRRAAAPDIESQSWVAAAHTRPHNKCVTLLVQIHTSSVCFMWCCFRSVQMNLAVNSWSFWHKPSWPTSLLSVIP